MRRKDREITGFENLVEVIKKCEVCHVAFHDEEYPYVVPMNFGFHTDGEKIELYFHGAASGKKHDLIRKNNKVSFVMEHTGGLITGPSVGVCESSMLFECVMGTGIIEYMPEEDKREALKAIVNQYHIHEGENFHFNEKMVPYTSVLCLKVREMTGKIRAKAKSL